MEKKIKINPTTVDALQSFHAELQMAKNKGEVIKIMRRRGAAYGWWSDIPKELWDKLEGMGNRQ
jgi:hypothetical protein